MALHIPNSQTADHQASQCISAAHSILAELCSGNEITTTILRNAMETAFKGSDANGCWTWKLAYETCEIALLLFLRQYGHALSQNSQTPATLLKRIEKLARRMPTHTRRSEEMVALQQFSTPLPLAFAAATAAQMNRNDIVLEPSTGTGLLAIFAEMADAKLHLNELSDFRCQLLKNLFSRHPVTQFDAGNIDDFLDRSITPTVVIMNPPFSAQARMEKNSTTVTGRHILSALRRLAPGGRLVTITGSNFWPTVDHHKNAFAQIMEMGTILFCATIDGKVYAKHGTTFDTQMIVIDKTVARDRAKVARRGHADDVATLLQWLQDIPKRLGTTSIIEKPRVLAFPSTPPKAAKKPGITTRTSIEGVPLEYETTDARAADNLNSGLYEPFELTSIKIPKAQPHSSKLVQSTAMASVLPPKPSYSPILPPSLIENGTLSDAQLETIILAGEAHSTHLDRQWTYNAEENRLTEAADDNADAIRYRRGFMLGDGTGAGKGRQAAGIILDNWLQGRRKAIWISISDKLIEDAQRDIRDLGLEPLLVFPLDRFKPAARISMTDGILFTTYATIRNPARVKQILEWVGRDFDGAFILDEAHALANAAGGKGERGEISASMQGQAGLKLQRCLPEARLLYVSATGATTVENLAYAERLGLWTSSDFPFASRQQFLETMEHGGVAAMEVLARDLRSLGLYTSRLLSYEGVEYDFLEHHLTDEQIDCYDSYAKAFRIIHQNLGKALEVTNVTGAEGTYNRNAKSAAYSAFESLKQRLFRNLLTSMSTTSLLKAMEQDLDNGASPVVQLVTTGAAMTERKLAEIDPSDWHDLQFDMSPREGVIAYLTNSFPTNLYAISTDGDGNTTSQPITIDGNPVTSRQAEALRDELIEDIAALSPLPTALDQIVQHFGTEQVAEVTGRQRRIVRKDGKLVIETRPASANSSEVDMFQSDRKKILIFSGAGGTGRSYHADLNAINQRRRHHYLLEPGWRADAAIQGLGRTNRTNQKQPPLFRPVASNVKAEKRFLSTIARRLDTLGAITRGQRQTGGQGMFRPEDNLESSYARDALRQFYKLVYIGRIEGFSYETFQTWTALRIADENGLKDDLPPINTFLNRLLALPINLQNIAFEAFEKIIDTRVEKAIAAGSYDVGIETLTGDSIRIISRETIYSHPNSSSETELVTLKQIVPTHPPSLAAIEEIRLNHDSRTIPATYMRNEKSGHVALVHQTSSMWSDDGEIVERVRIVRPLTSNAMHMDEFRKSMWVSITKQEFAHLWKKEIEKLPSHTEITSHMVCGLLLPIWNRLPIDTSMIYKATTDDGIRLIGRRVPASWAAMHSQNATSLSADNIIEALNGSRQTFDLQGNLQIHAVKVMHVQRFELKGWTKPMRDQLRAMGLFSEIINNQLRFFIPADQKNVLEKLLETYPAVRAIAAD